MTSKPDDKKTTPKDVTVTQQVRGATDGPESEQYYGRTS